MTLRKITLAFLFLSGLLNGIGLINATFFKVVMGWLTPCNTVVLFIFALLHGLQRFGWKRILMMFVTVSAVSLAFESVGVATGKIYGGYHLYDQICPKLVGLVL